MLKLLALLIFLAPDSDWAQWRGPNRDGLSPDTGLLKQWPAGGPPLAWKATGLGGGYSSVSILGDRIYTLGDQGDACNLLALNSADGKIVWSTRVGPAGGHPKYPGPRSSPSVEATLIFALGQDGDLICAETATGKERWRKHLQKDFQGRMMSGWRWSESPLLDGDKLLCTPGGPKGSVIALKKATGELIWQTTELTDKAAYSSLVPAEIGGIRQYLVLTEVSVAGIASDSGKVLWRIERKIEKATAIVATPVCSGGHVFVTSSYEFGTCNGYKVTAEGAQFKVDPVYSGSQLKNHHGGVVVVGDHVYGTNDQTLKCLDLKTGKEIWADRSVGKGSITYADGHLVVRSERGPVALVEATPEGYKEKGRFNQPDRSKENSWAHPVIIGGKLYLRDQDILLCYDVKAK